MMFKKSLESNMDFTKMMEAFMLRLKGSCRIQMGLNVATKVTNDPMAATELVKTAINEKLVEVVVSPDPVSGNDRAWLVSPIGLNTIHRTISKWSYNDHMLHPLEVDALNILQGVRFRVCKRMFKFIQTAKEKNSKIINRSDRRVVGQVEDYLRHYTDGEFVQKYMMSDGRRLYAGMNALSHQGGDLQRGLVEFARASRVVDLTAWLNAIRDEYGVTFSNYKAILTKPMMLWKDHKSLGLSKASKPFCILRAALALEEVRTTGRTAYILQQDQTCSGFQEMAVQFHCPVLATLTNLQGGDKQDLYTMAGLMAKGLCSIRGLEEFFVRGPAKFFVLRVGYGAAAAGLARGMILDNAQESEVEYLSNTGAYIPGVLEELDEDFFNPTFKDMLKPMGWERAVRATQEISKAYHKGLMEISPKLRDGLRMIKAANTRAIEDGGFLEWTLPNGVIKRLDGWVLDPAAQPVRITMRDGNGKKFQFCYIPMVRGVKSSKAPPVLMHSLDGCRMIDQILWAGQYEVDIAPIHDSTGTDGEHFVLVKNRWIRRLREQCEMPSTFMEMMSRYRIQIPKTFGDMQQLVIPQDASHFMG